MAAMDTDVSTRGTVLKTTRLIPALAGATLVAATLAGCASVPPLQQVTLSPPQTQSVPTRPSGWTVRRVQVPEYLDNYGIQLRKRNYVLMRMANAKWAERLPEAVTRLLQQTIDQKLETKRKQHDVVHVDIDTFEPQPSGKVVLSASWRVNNAQGGLVARHDTVITEPLPAQPSPDQVGEAMSTAVRELAMQIVARAG